MFAEEDTYYDDENPYHVEENSRRASYSGHGLFKPFDHEASGRVESRDVTFQVAPYVRNVAW